MTHTPPDPPEQPPFLGSWPRVYALVIGGLLLQIVLLWLFTYAYR